MVLSFLLKLLSLSFDSSSKLAAGKVTEFHLLCEALAPPAKKQEVHSGGFLRK